MASETLKHRPPPKDELATATAGSTKDQKLALARRGLRSLAVAVAIPTVATAASISVAGTSISAAVAASPSGTRLMWAFHVGSLLMSGLLGLSAWLVWAKGGFHGRSEALPLYLAELVMELLWAPLLFGSRSAWPAMAVCAAHFVVLFLLAQSFRHVNPVAADLIKPYLAWVSFLAVVNYLLL
ncbi:translocator protein homolog [Curcuma longa]|uniref:translocator protein homolog n=1 Tax=Curcuma longa TaxID=136217 RepID=UPI003D9F728F